MKWKYAIYKLLNSIKEVKIIAIVKNMGVAYVFSKIQPKATIMATITLVFVALALYLVPGLGLIFALFATIPGIVLWNKSIQSFGISALITVIITTVLGNTFVLSAIILVLIASLIIGQLLKERTSEERILYVTTVAMSLISLIAFMLLTNIRKNSTFSELGKTVQAITA